MSDIIIYLFSFSGEVGLLDFFYNTIISRVDYSFSSRYFYLWYIMVIIYLASKNKFLILDIFLIHLSYYV